MKRIGLLMSCMVFVIGPGGCGDDDSGGGGGGSPLPLESVIESCAKRQVCGGDFEFCMDDYLWEVSNDLPGNLLSIINTHYECMLQASSCNEVAQCDNEIICTSSESHCEGNTWVGCFFGVTIREQCPDESPQCVEESGYADCSYGTCTAEQEEESWCEGRYIVECYEGMTTRYDCASPPNSPNSTCHEFEWGADCATGQAGDCDWSTFEDHCEGSVRVRCMDDVIDRFDCSNLEYETMCEEEDGNSWCVLPGTDCDWDDAECNGTVLTFCDYEVLMEFDCAELGLSCVGSGEEARCAAPASADSM